MTRTIPTPQKEPSTMPKIIKALMAALALALAVALAPIVASSPAQAKGSDCLYDKVSRRHERSSYEFSAGLWYKKCYRARPGRDIVWIKPQGFTAAYNQLSFRDHHFCTPRGSTSYFVFRMYLWNNETGYNHHQYQKVDCDGTFNNGIKGAQHFPRCYMPWIIDHAGRIETGHRARCHARWTVERVRWGPWENKHYNIGRSIIEP